MNHVIVDFSIDNIFGYSGVIFVAMSLLVLVVILLLKSSTAVLLAELVLIDYRGVIGSLLSGNRLVGE